MDYKLRGTFVLQVAFRWDVGFYSIYGAATSAWVIFIRKLAKYLQRFCVHFRLPLFHTSHLDTAAEAEMPSVDFRVQDKRSEFWGPPVSHSNNQSR